jgi:hypothetical protein
MLPSDMRDKKYQKDPTFVSPEVHTYDTTMNFTGGNLASNFDSFDKLFDYKRTRDGDGDDTVWTTAIVIYQENGSCGNPTGDIPVVGFATMKIAEVVAPPAGGKVMCLGQEYDGPPGGKVICGQITCNNVDTGRGGGGEYGTKGSIPGLVQ